MALSAIQRTLIDPESMRIREESWTPLFASVTDYLDREPVWSICVDVNAKNRIGGYTGFQTWIVNILHGAPTSSDAAHGPTGPDGRGECRHGPADPARVFATPT